MRAAVLPVQGRPDEEELRRAAGRRTTDLGLADGAYAPGAVLGAVHRRGIHRHGLAGVADLALPAPELREARGVHHDAPAGLGGLAALLHARGARGKGQVAGDAGLVVVERDARHAHRLHDLDPERPAARVGWIGGRAARAVEGVLLAAAHDAEAAVQDAPVRVEAHGHAEVELPVVGVAVEPVAIVHVAITGGGVRHRLGRLVDRVVVQSGKHGNLLALRRIRSRTGASSGGSRPGARRPRRIRAARGGSCSSRCACPAARPSTGSG